MSALHSCPEIESWDLLFSDTLPPEQQLRYQRHLESCPACQEQLDQEPSGVVWRRLGRQVGDPTLVPTDAALTQLLERMHEETVLDRPTSVEPVDLYFLRPTDRVDLLGTLGEYEVREVIGQGGMGIVLKAHEPALHRLVAIKVLAPALAGSATARKRFTREAQAAAAVCHDHVVPVHGVKEVDGLPYLVMQYVAGESLQQRLDRTGPLEVIDVVRIGQQTASGLAAAHAQGLIHRDIKPANLLLEDGLTKVKITDFGLARMIDDVGLTQTGVVAGTPEYMAPEQARGEPIDHRADLFSLGSVLYALCAGYSPFRGATALAVIRRVNDETPTPLRSLNPEVPAWLETLIRRLLAKHPDNRFQNAAEVADLLAGYLAHLRQPATVAAPVLPAFPEDASRQPPKPRFAGLGSRVSLALLVALLLLAILGLPWWYQVANPPEARQPKQAEFSQDFRKNQPWNSSLVWSGKVGDEEIESEEQGLRIRLTEKRTYKYPCGVALKTSVHGDFEITAGYELVQANPPRRGKGVGFELYLTLDNPRREALGLLRARWSDGGEGYTPMHNVDRVGAPRQYYAPPTPADGPEPLSKTGRLRITRVGTTATFWVAEGNAAEFRELVRREVGTEDLNLVRMSAYAGEFPEPVDVRLIDLKVRAESLDPALVAEQVQLATPPTGGRRWLLAVLLIAAAGAILFLGCILLAMRRRQSESETAPEPEQVEPLAAPKVRAIKAKRTPSE